MGLALVACGGDEEAGDGNGDANGAATTHQTGDGGAHAAADLPDLPAAPFTDRAVMAMWIDADMLSPQVLRKSVQAIFDAAPDVGAAEAMQQMRQEAMMSLGMAQPVYDNLTRAGVKGMLAVAEPGDPAEDMGAGDPMVDGKAYTMLHVAEGTTAEQVRSAMMTIAQGMGQPTENVEQMELTAVGDQWLAISDPRSPMSAVPAGGTQANADAFAGKLAHAGGSHTMIVINATDQFRQQVAGMAENPMIAQTMGPAAAFLGDLESMTTGLSLGDQPGLRLSLTVLNPQTATEIKEQLDGLMANTRMQMRQQVEQQPELQPIIDQLQQLQVNVDGATLSLGLNTKQLGALAAISALRQQQAEQQAASMPAHMPMDDADWDEVDDGM
jgi:hypothetical protein